MLVMAFPPVEKRVIAGEYVVAEHKPNGRGLVNMQPWAPPMPSGFKSVDGPDLLIEQSPRLR